MPITTAIGYQNKGNAWIKPIPVQHLSHILEECRRRQVFIFEDDAFADFAQESRGRATRT